MSKILYFIAGAVVAMGLVYASAPVVARGDLPAPVVRLTLLPTIQTPTTTPTPAPTMQPVLNPMTGAGQLGLTGQIQCFGCVPTKVKVKLSNYEPLTGPDSCFDYEESNGYCYSPTFPGVHWKGVWGLTAACPFDWPLGTWVEVPGVLTVICMDRGGRIICDDNDLCRVDVLGPGGAYWNQLEYEAIIWVPVDPERK